MSSLMQLVYVSQAAMPIDSDRLDQIGAHSDENNRALGVTGVLLYNSGHFMQVLEGHEAVVQRLFQTIQEDWRHEDVRKLLFDRIESRQFGKWSMGVMNLEVMAEVDRDRFVELAELLERRKELLDVRQRIRLLFAEFAHECERRSAA